MFLPFRCYNSKLSDVNFTRKKIQCRESLNIQITTQSPKKKHFSENTSNNRHKHATPYVYMLSLYKKTVINMEK